MCGFVFCLLFLLFFFLLWMHKYCENSNSTIGPESPAYACVPFCDCSILNTLVINWSRSLHADTFGLLKEHKFTCSLACSTAGCFPWACCLQMFLSWGRLPCVVLHEISITFALQWVGSDGALSRKQHFHKLTNGCACLLVSWLDLAVQGARYCVCVCDS